MRHGRTSECWDEDTCRYLDTKSHDGQGAFNEESDEDRSDDRHRLSRWVEDA